MQNMRTRALGIFAFVAGAALASSGCAMFKGAMGSGQGAINLGNLPSAISGMAIFKSGDPLATSKVEYPISGKGNYDSFFRDAAISRASLVVSTAGVDALTMNLKNIARTRFAMTELANDSADIPDEAVAKMALKKDSLNAENKMFILDALKDVAQIADFMNTTVNKSQALVATGTKLLGRVSADFVGPDAMKIPAITRGLQGSLENLKGLAAESPVFLKRVARLTAALNALK